MREARIYLELPIPRKVKKVWDAWDLRVCIAGSLVLQACLVLLAPLRQRWKNTLLRVFIWTAYLLADWIAAVAIGTITKTLGDVGHLRGNDNLCALWASFLLLHLGGPDTITSFSLEDNELWLRTLFGLILQVLSAAYSLYLTLPQNNLWIPTILVFTGGTIKFAERTRALYLASLDHFGSTVLPDPNPGPDYEEAAGSYSSSSKSQSETSTMTTTMKSSMATKVEKNNTLGYSSELKLLEVAYARFESFKGLIVGFLISSKDRESSRTYFLNDNAITAFRLIEYELSFMYQVLHTKAVVLHTKLGYILRSISFFSVVSAAIKFYFIRKPAADYGKLELKLTYILFTAAIVLDLISIFNVVFSDWILMHRRHRRWLGKVIPSFVSRRRRWCGKISQYDMISHCLIGNKMLNNNSLLIYRVVDYLGLKEVLDVVKIRLYSTSEPVPDYLKEFIFAELKRKIMDNSSDDKDDGKSSWGEVALRRAAPRSYAKLKWSFTEFGYSESLLVWHIATELCRHEAEDKSSFEGGGGAGGDGKAISKLVSDYMFYLLVMKPTMLAPVLGNWHVVFRDTSADSARYFSKHGLSESFEVYTKTATAAKAKFGRGSAAEVKVGAVSKSVFFDACVLAHQLRLEVYGRWNVMSQVWVEMLSYAAINCRSVVHAQQVSKGGELLTFTWLMMNHLGLGTQFADDTKSRTASNDSMGIIK